MDRHDTIGQDLVNHCINDIAVLGARPLFFLDYIAAGKLEPAVFRQLLGGLAKACRAAGCAIIGGETGRRCPACIGKANTTWPAPSSALWIARRFWMDPLSDPATC